jgi:gas vesicle protein
MSEYSRYEDPNWQLENISTGRPAGSTIAWLLAGIGIGAGIALLLAPSSGREARDWISRGCRRTIDGISRGTQGLRQRGSKLLNFGSKHSEEQRSQQG